MAVSYAFMPETCSVISVIDGIASPMTDRCARWLSKDFRETAKRLPSTCPYFTARADEIDAALIALNNAEAKALHASLAELEEAA